MRYLIFFSLTVLLYGCGARVPEPVPHPYSSQEVMQASEHWQILAADLANRINNEMILSGNIDRAVYVKETCGNDKEPCNPHETSAFNEAFRDLLITNLFSYGIPTNKIGGGEAIEVQYKVQVVRYRAQRVRTIKPGVLTALSAAIVVLRNAPTDAIILATGAGLDVLNSSLTGKSDHEVIITTSLIDQNQYLFRASDIYYINNRDSFHYQQSTPAAKTINLSARDKN